MTAKSIKRKSDNPVSIQGYDALLSGMVSLIEEARRVSARTVNAIMTATYWEIGRRIVENEQGGKRRAGYGKALLKQLSTDLTSRFGRGFAKSNLYQMRGFYLTYQNILQTVSGESDSRKFQTPSGKSQPRQLQTPSAELSIQAVSDQFPLPWSAYVRLLSLRSKLSRTFYEQEALILHLEHFLLELGGDFTFVGRQKRLRIGDEWYRVDLIFFHRRLRCLVVIDLKRGRFTHADAGQMHMYLNYAREHWTHPDENPPVGLILCAMKNSALAKYALQGLPNKVLAAEYKMVLPDENLIAEELKKTKKLLEERG